MLNIVINAKVGKLVMFGLNIMKFEHIGKCDRGSCDIGSCNIDNCDNGNCYLDSVRRKIRHLMS